VQQGGRDSAGYIRLQGGGQKFLVVIRLIDLLTPNRSPDTTANWAISAARSRGGIFQLVISRD
jgi:hypothetical protein